MSFFKGSNDQIELPLLPMRDIVVFPHMTTPFFIGRKQSLEALEQALAGDRKIFVVAQKDPMVENPKEEDLFQVGTIGSLLQIMRLPNGTIKALYEANERAKLVSSDLEGSSYSVVVEPYPVEVTDDIETESLISSVKNEFKAYLKKSSKTLENLDSILKSNGSGGEVADLIAPQLNISVEKKQELLELSSSKLRLEQVYIRMLEEEETKKIEQKLKERVQSQIGRTQKEYYLNEQMKAIQKELGADDAKAEIGEYEEKIKSAGMSAEAQETAEKELKKLKMMPPMSSEANIVRNYLDWLLQIPWSASSDDNFDIQNAQKILDEDHYGLEKVKDRIVEYIAVANMVGKLKGPIICLVGPPGVGKTSLAKSVARALGRSFVRMSLGGVRDEAEIRGHRRTYIGALPGKIIQSMKKAKTRNPLLLMDEIDKMTQSHMGDPSSALLEVLDPEQNNTFMDHYLEVEYDLSNVLFFCTANSLQDIPMPLRDRMEIINLSGYTELEKEQIVTRYLVPKQMKENGLVSSQIRFYKDAIFEVIRRYTKEAGVRNVERNIGKLCRKAVTELVKSDGKTSKVTITKKKVNNYLGVPVYSYGKIEEKNEIGIATGMAWTSFGGELLSIEVTGMKGSGKIQLTGKLGDVMKESAQAAISYVRTNANQLGIYSHVFKDMDIHIHVPEGATPKDGPSAGVTLTTALVSFLTGIPVKKEVAMTGEITLRGKVLPIGGLKEKLLAAKRGMLETILIPKENEKDLAEVPKEISGTLDIFPASNVKFVLEKALERMPQSVSDDELEENKGESVEVINSFTDEDSNSVPAH